MLPSKAALADAALPPAGTPEFVRGKRHDTREQTLFVALRWMSLGLPPIFAVLLLQVVAAGLPASSVLWLFVLSMPLPIVYFARSRLPTRWAAALTLLATFVIVLYLQANRGLTPGAALLTSFQCSVCAARGGTMCPCAAVSAT
jgi:hypothetical protein